MTIAKPNKFKIFNDPVHGFIKIPYEIIFDLLEHPYFQRLRRIKQLGLTHLVYPGAMHTRFQHALGAMHLTINAIELLKIKGFDISEDEAKAVCIAILLHDIGHGPFSHALEHSIVHKISHEDISIKFMNELSFQYGKDMEMALKIFNNTYDKKFLHQLVSSQLDMDRLDYLKRDSFFTGVSEGVISSDRIINMLNIANDELVVEVKGIYSIEKFIIARRLMYWQVYLHKTVISAEKILIKILQRAKYLASQNVELFATPVLKYFLYHDYCKTDFDNDQKVLKNFASLDDYDIFASIKTWTLHDDKILSYLCDSLINRDLFKIELQNKPFTEEYITYIKSKVKKSMNLNDDEIEYIVIKDIAVNNAYNPLNNKINILMKDGKTVDIAEASDQLNIAILTEPVTKYFLCYPKHFI